MPARRTICINFELGPYDTSWSFTFLLSDCTCFYAIKQMYLTSSAQLLGKVPLNIEDWPQAECRSASTYRFGISIVWPYFSISLAWHLKISIFDLQFYTIFLKIFLVQSEMYSAQIIYFLQTREDQRAHFLLWNQNSKFCVTWSRIAQSVYFLGKCIYSSIFEW